MCHLLKCCCNSMCGCECHAPSAPAGTPKSGFYFDAATQEEVAVQVTELGRCSVDAPKEVKAQWVKRMAEARASAPPETVTTTPPINSTCEKGRSPEATIRRQARRLAKAILREELEDRDGIIRGLTEVIEGKTKSIEEIRAGLAGATPPAPPKEEAWKTE